MGDFHLKVLEKCQFQEAVKEKKKGLDSVGKALTFWYTVCIYFWLGSPMTTNSF